MSIILRAKKVMFCLEYVFLSLCQQLHVKTTDHIFIDVLANKAELIKFMETD